MNITLKRDEKTDSTDQQQALIPQKHEENTHTESSRALNNRKRMT
jgi:hypothetical protein